MTEVGPPDWPMTALPLRVFAISGSECSGLTGRFKGGRGRARARGGVTGWGGPGLGPQVCAANGKPTRGLTGL